ncbi:hypothetical protein [Montanilutibacter psychrotolerans]|uniref:Uncharacterized protein n=1 Tax=Montanilutibacter psychrotolerans TaxID=1327343 RepID=A0A3M8SL63_9GAMM|nr:hypothetical protein [Lysobacter psychrotolerans]RNF82051.1 hypothetical protein EER27_15495 [Lysobacter psychrotolerans]
MAGAKKSSGTTVSKTPASKAATPKAAATKGTPAKGAAARTTVAKSAVAKGLPAKGPPAGSDGNLHKRFESERISTDIADFEKSGGRVEVLGVTRVLQKIEPLPGDKVAAPPKPARKR